MGDGNDSVDTEGAPTDARFAPDASRQDRIGPLAAELQIVSFTAQGQEGNDVLVGHHRDYDDDGNQTLDGGGGDDRLSGALEQLGGPGSDVLAPGADCQGFDVFHFDGGPGADQLEGSPANDVLIG